MVSPFYALIGSLNYYHIDIYYLIFYCLVLGQILGIDNKYIKQELTKLSQYLPFTEHRVMQLLDSGFMELIKLFYDIVNFNKSVE